MDGLSDLQWWLKTYILYLHYSISTKTMLAAVFFQNSLWMNLYISVLIKWRFWVSTIIFFLKKHNMVWQSLLLCQKYFHFQTVSEYLCVFSCLAGNQVSHIASVIPNDQLHRWALVPQAYNSQSSDVTRLWKKHYIHGKDFYNKCLVIQFQLESSHFLHWKTNQETYDHRIFTSVLGTQPHTNWKT